MKSFPFVLGTDIIHVTRLDPLKSSSRFVRLAHRILHENELSSAKERSALASRSVTHRTLHEWLTTAESPVDSEQHPSTWYERQQDSANAAAKWLAGRWAAKEAAKKAWGASLLGWKDVRVEVVNNEQFVDFGSNAVRIVCQPYHQSGYDFGETPKDWRIQQEGMLSISHDGEYSVATVIAEPLTQELSTIFEKRTKIVRERNETRRKEQR